MILLKLSSFLAFFALVVCQMDSLQAAPFRPDFESVMPDHVALSDEEARHLLNALVKEFVQMKADELDQVTEDNSLDRPRAKRCSNLSTCLLGKLSQELHRLHTYTRTDVGARTPGKKRDVLNDLENDRYTSSEDVLGSN